MGNFCVGDMKSVVFFGHHKCGSRFFRNSIMKPLAAANGRNLYGYEIREPVFHFSTAHDLDLYNIDFSVIASDPGCVLNLSNAGAPVVERIMPMNDRILGVHAVRDPRQLLISNYFYHKEGHKIVAPDQWFWEKLKADRPILERLSVEDGLRYELDNITRDILENQLAPWTGRENIIEFKLEEFSPDERTGLDNLEKLCAFCGFENMPDVNLSRTWSNEAAAQSWRTLFSESLKATFKERYGSLLIQLGYEENYDW